MPRHPVVQLSNGADGINRFNDGSPSKRQARAFELTEGLDVINIDGDLQRREAFVATHVAAPHVLPCGMCAMKVVNAAESSFSTRADRGGALDNERLYFGANVTFNGILFEHLALGGGSTTTALSSALEYWDGSAWVEIFHIDFTRGRTAGANDRFQPWQRNGVVAWHYPVDAAGDSTWATTAVDGVTKFWVRMTVVQTTSRATADIPERAATVSAPGLRACQFGGVNGLIPVRFGSGNQQLLVGSDRWKDKRGSELGAMLGVVEGNQRQTRKLRLIDRADLRYEGAGWYGVDGNVNWALSANAWTEGVANQLEKIRQDFDWKAESESAADSANRAPVAEFRGGRIIAALVPAAVSGDTITFSGTPAIGSTEGQYEHHILRCVNRGSGGPAVGEERIVYASSGEQISVYDDWSATPDANNRFDLIRPHHDVTLVGSPSLTYMVDNMDSGGQHIGFVRGRPFATDPDVSATQPDSKVFFEIGRELRWSIRSGVRWSGVVDSITRKAIIANGGPLLEYDGRRLRRFEADTTSDFANYMKAKLKTPNRPGQGGTKLIGVQELLGHPNECKYVVDYGGFLVISGIPGEPRAVQWSLPGGGNAIWPKGFIQNISDSQNDEISGMATVGDRLVIFTPTAVHEAQRPNSLGFLTIQQVSSGLGFVSHQSVAPAEFGGSQVLFGCAAGGVHAYTGAGQWTTILDKWERVFGPKINHRAIHRAVAACWQERGWYMLALPGGGSEANNLLYIYDWINQRHWAWTLPWGCSSIVSSCDIQGFETIYFGSDDGFIHTLRDAETDDGEAVAGVAQTIPARYGGDKQVAFVRAMLELRDLGGGSVTANTYIDEKRSYGGRITPSAAVTVNQAKAMTHSTGQSQFDVANYDGSILSDDRYVETDLPLKMNTRGTRFAIEINGTSRWALKNAQVQARPLGHKRGKRRG